MHVITDSQVDFILDDLARKGVHTEDVRMNLLDHVCCIIEHEMPPKANFYEFYERILPRFYKSDLKEIEDETQQLVKFKYYHAMKRTLKITGATTVALILLGSLFKFQHWPGAGALLFLALAFFGLVFLPLNIIMKNRDEKNQTNKIIITFGFLLGIGIVAGLLFKVFHWPGANILMFGTLAVFSGIFIPLYFFTRFRNPETKFNAIVHTTFMVAGAGLFFSLINLKNSDNIEQSVESMEAFKANNIEQLDQSNERLYSSLNASMTDDLTTLQSATDKMDNHLKGTIAKLLSVSHDIPFEKAKSLSYKDANYPNDNVVIRQAFEHGKHEYTYQELKKQIESYNSIIDKNDSSGVLRQINIEDLQMTNTILSVVLINLTEIRMQVLANENSYLCMKKGNLANL